MMLSSIPFTALAAVLFLTFQNAAPTSGRRLTGRLTGPGSDLENSYIIKLKDGTNTTSHINSLPFLFSADDENSPITHFWPEFFIGYSGIFVGSDLDAILASPDVEYVEKNGIVRGADSRTNEPWSLQAISTQQPVGGTDVDSLIYTYSYNQPIGEGVDIYILDGGVYIQHEEFEGRATYPWAARGLAQDAGNGHGTHVAGIAAGKTYGVAKRANIIAVRILDNTNFGTNANTLSGINWIAGNVRSTGRPSIACMAFNGERKESINDATTILVGDRVTVVAAAGNNGQDASGSSPASAEAIIVVASSDIKNVMASNSNFGSLVDVFAPGVEVISAWITGPTSAWILSGTSMACAHVAGLAAYLLSADPTLTPGPMFDRILELATQNAISGVPAGTTTAFVYNGGAQ